MNTTDFLTVKMFCLEVITKIGRGLGVLQA